MNDEQRIDGNALRERGAWWDRSPFTGISTSHVSGRVRA